MATFIDILFISEYGFLPMNKIIKIVVKTNIPFLCRTLWVALCRNLAVLVFFVAAPIVLVCVCVCVFHSCFVINE